MSVRCRTYALHLTLTASSPPTRCGELFNCNLLTIGGSTATSRFNLRRHSRYAPTGEKRGSAGIGFYGRTKAHSFLSSFCCSMSQTVNPQSRYFLALPIDFIFKRENAQNTLSADRLDLLMDWAARPGPAFCHANLVRCARWRGSQGESGAKRYRCSPIFRSLQLRGTAFIAPDPKISFSCSSLHG